MNGQLAPHITIPEPKLAFHPDRISDRDIHPLRGLLRFGPYSNGMLLGPIRVATVSPAGESARLYSFMSELNSQARPSERLDYMPPWPGFQSSFRPAHAWGGQGLPP